MPVVCDNTVHPVDIGGYAAEGSHAALNGNGLFCHLRPWGHPGPSAARGMSAYVVLWQPGSVLRSQAPFTTKDHADVPGLDCCLRHYIELSCPLPGERTRTDCDWQGSRGVSLEGKIMGALAPPLVSHGVA